jgi:hypothetical protein
MPWLETQYAHISLFPGNEKACIPLKASGLRALDEGFDDRCV